MTRKRLGDLLRLTGINGALFLLGVVAVELVLGNWFVSYVLPRPLLAGRTFEFAQTLYQPPSTVTLTFDRYGLRGVRGPTPSIDLVTVGGSTTAQMFISDGETWQDVIRSLTGIVVANAGIDGMGSQSVPEILEDWIDEIPGLKAKYFLHYVGVNDVGMTQDAPAPERRRHTSWTRRIQGRSAIVQGIGKLRDLVAGPQADFVSHGVALAPDPGAIMIPVEVERGEIVSYLDRVYRPNLRDILDLHERRGETAIMVTQTTNPALISKKKDGEFVSTPDLTHWAATLDEVNRATAEVCRERQRTCRLVDLAGDLSFEPSDFYDAVHNTPQGARKVGEFLARQVAPLLHAQD